MYRLLTLHKVKIEAVHKERRDRSCKLCHCHENLIEGLVGRELVCIHSTAPESLSSESHIPVAEMVAYEILDQTSCRSDIIILVCSHNILHKGVEQRDHPSVDLRTLAHRHLFSLRIKSVDIRIKSEE